ncbi:MAG TPA: class I SAM-dependent methyltransferase [archaeon]|nr:class I SAM-dependent methyltransferase [archaeon]
MRFSEYMKPLDENLRSAAIRLLGEDAGRYADLQDEILAGCDHFRSGRLKTLQEFYRLAVSKGIVELGTRANTLSCWAADEISGEIEGHHAIDVGCCSGTFTVFYALNNLQTNFVGIDLSIDALFAAKKRAESYSAANTSWVCADVMTLDSPFTTADTVIVQNSMYQMLPKNSNEDLFLDRLTPFMRKGSKVIFSYPTMFIIPQYLALHNSQHAMFDLKREEIKTVFSQTTNNYESRILTVYRKL